MAGRGSEPSFAAGRRRAGDGLSVTVLNTTNAGMTIGAYVMCASP